jgi:hypothetical protein
MAQQLTEHKIDKLTSFQQVTANPRQVAGLYFYLILDCLVDLAHKISYDFFKRPHLYIDLSQAQSQPTTEEETNEANKGSTSIAPILARLHAQYGANEFLPSRPQRDEIYIPIFGRAAGYSAKEEGDFPRLRDEFLNAAAAFSERVFDTGKPMLLERARTTFVPFREYLDGLQGESLRWSTEEVLPQLTEHVSYTILRNEGVGGVFGVHNRSSEGPIDDWPYTERSRQDILVYAVSKQLAWDDQPGEMHITREHFSNLQRAALRGAEALATVMDFDENLGEDDLELLIRKAYTWGAALMALDLRTSEQWTKTEQPTPAEQNSKLTMGHTILYSPVRR